MDVAYDHLSESFTDDTTTTTATASTSSSTDNQPPQTSSLNADLQDAYRAFSNSPWGARIGGFFGSVVKQVEPVYREAEKELVDLGQDATRGLTDLRTTILNRTRALSLTTGNPPPASSSSASATEKDGEATATTPTAAARGMSAEDALKESETVLSRLRGEAAKRLKDLQKAEDAADEALLRFGSNLRDFLKDAIKIAPPTEGSSAGGDGNTVLFESKDAQGKRVIHTSRFDAQLHVIHTSDESFTKDAIGPEFEAWYKEFDVDKKTDDIAQDLAKYPELRATMEKLVPDQVPYADFWKRYYFLRHGIETAEARRRDLLKAASAEEEVGWDEDSDDEAAPAASKATPAPNNRPGSTESSTTLHPQSTQNLLKPSEPRKSNDEKSQADSEASYDVVGARSGVPSQAPNSPKDSRKGEDSDEEDWE
ncbi:BSD domain-containing protein 1-B [Echria macrotheca]|uniref:BSD domain-containing protein 1-B n=1 Tax=Echria macrotheca TaxID=438768 RepID=A0AAJ0F6J1_9PEZI|nr:BSD domain-containing protein 1-B [Echria macrotheca]